MKILLIEDSTETAQSLALLLKLEGFEVVTCACDKTAPVDDYDLVIADYYLNCPIIGETGVSIYNRLNALRQCKMPGILMTGAAGSDLEKATREAKAAGMKIVTKPYPGDKIAQLVRDTIASAL